MTKREINLKIFQKQPVPGIFFQPRIEPWYAWHKQFNSLPERFASGSLLDLYDQLDISMRYIHYYSGVPDPVVPVYEPELKITRQEKDDYLYVTYHTPLGDLLEKQKFTIDRTWRTVGFAVSNKHDLDILEWVCNHTNFSFNRDHFEQGDHYVGDRGEPQFWLPKSPYQALAQIWMKTEDFIYALADIPETVEKVLAAIDRSYDRLFGEIADSGAVNIINFGENIHAQLLSPRYFEKYFIPYYQKRCCQLREAGIFSHVHIDGDYKPLLKYLPDLPFDGFEALTPLPQGDVSLEETKEHIGRKILLDGIPAVLFLPQHPFEELQKCVEKIIDYFSPNLVLGISDELPQGAEEDSIRRLEWVVEYCKKRGQR
ncbi:hypothetical protein JW935_14945 [candidate division KSB1 bacterium]|nr:hypothetical protein [candidate division KSB1 bacterium]